MGTKCALDYWTGTENIGDVLWEHPEPSPNKKSYEFIHNLSDSYVLQEDSVPWYYVVSRRKYGGLCSHGQNGK